MNEPQLTDVHTPSHEDSPSETVTRNTEIPLSTVEQLPCGYAIREEIARGGMGVVYRGHDAALNREVAIKILQDKYDPNGFTAQRFVEEAQINGQLQHPGIPPIHHVGTWHDGRPFLAMKLIKGRTLEEMIKAGESFNVLAVFEAIAHAVGYAHAHRVIHRDLKPANIMVGSFGEVQVMDWGLAKLMDRDGQEANAIAADPNATTDLGTRICSTIDEREVTQDGDILGTPAFMPPEQAIGAIDEIDARSDVFGLGAVLCAMLTGKPPYLGENAKSTRQMAARGKLNEAFARLDASQAEPELIALCKRCLNVERWQRPADGNTVAQEVAKLRTAAEERAKQAELNEAKAEVRSAEQAKRRHLMNWSAAVVMGVLAAGVTVSLWQAKVALREAWNARTAEVNAERQFQAAQEARVLAETNEQRANDRTKLALDAYGDFVFGIQNQLANRPGTQDLRRALLELLARVWRRFWTTPVSRAGPIPR